MDNDGLLTRQQAAAYLGVTAGTLAVWACTRRYDIPFIKVGRAVRYRRADLDRWLADRTVTYETPVPVSAGGIL
ncbi:MAG: helix-turn-helix domain-containing protein [Planctomycetota bacterium]|jgi:excisionase family DNA binding protein